jgi:hypothetical protein
MRQILIIAAVALFVTAGLHALDGDWEFAVILLACAVISAIARERF